MNLVGLFPFDNIILEDISDPQDPCVVHLEKDPTEFLVSIASEKYKIAIVFPNNTDLPSRIVVFDYEGQCDRFIVEPQIVLQVYNEYFDLCRNSIQSALGVNGFSCRKL